MSGDPEVIIVGGGPGGLTLALELHARNIPFRIYESVTEYKPLGVGLNLLPHAVRSMDRLGVMDGLLACGIETKEYCFYTRNGQLVDSEPRGKFAGYDWPQISIHRADMHKVLLDAVLQRAGADAIVLDHKCVGVDQTDTKAIVRLQRTSTGEALPDVSGQVVIACDGVHSVPRVQLHPKVAVPRYEGTMQYRGVTRWKPFLTGATHLYMGTEETGKLVIYPIRDNIDGKGTQLINWVVEIVRPPEILHRDWSRMSTASEFVSDFAQCSFDFLDVPAILKAADLVFEYPMMDQEPLPSWTAGRVTLLGDAAHPMMPRGSNGAAQAILDAEVLANSLQSESDWPKALLKYEGIRRQATSKVVLANRSMAPDAVLRLVEERTGGKPFANIDDVISKQERTDWQKRYKEVVGFSVRDLHN